MSMKRTGIFGSLVPAQPKKKSNFKQSKKYPFFWTIKGDQVLSLYKNVWPTNGFYQPPDKENYGEYNENTE
jgi:hypothetical protein